jgi:hypothetical protein
MRRALYLATPHVAAYNLRWTNSLLLALFELTAMFVLTLAGVAMSPRPTLPTSASVRCHCVQGVLLLLLLLLLSSSCAIASCAVAGWSNKQLNLNSTHQTLSTPILPRLSTLILAK